MSNPDWYLDPPEEPESPRCPACDEQMSREQISRAVWYECHDPDCEECARKYKKAKAADD
jgi:hypothetical protein